MLEDIETIIYVPSLLQILVGSFFHSNSKRAILNHIDIYDLEFQISAEMNPYSEFQTGVYSTGDKKTKVFIKTWQGSRKTPDYYLLKNESLASSHLHATLNGTSFGSEVKTPRILKTMNSKDSFSIVYEYIEGDSLESLPLQERVIQISKCIEALYEVYKNLAPNIRFMNRGILFYLFGAPYLVLRLSVRDPILGVRLFSEFVRSVLTIPDLLGRGKTIAHRDLIAKNVLIRDGVLYIIDCEKVATTFRSYDETNFRIENNYPPLELGLPDNRFLKTFMLAQFILESPDSSRQAYYKSFLNSHA